MKSICKVAENYISNTDILVQNICHNISVFILYFLLLFPVNLHTFCFTGWGNIGFVFKAKIFLLSDQSNTQEWLQYFGYLNGEIGSLDLERYQDALEKMQKNYQIPATRDIDVLTEMEMLFPRCGVPDRVPEGDRDENNMQTNKRFVTVDTKWNKDTISYRLAWVSYNTKEES